MEKNEKALFVVLALNVLLGIYYLTFQVETFVLITSYILDKDFQYANYFFNTIVSAILILIIIVGLIISMKDGRFKMNNWIKIYVIYYMFTFVTIGIPNYVAHFFKLSIDSFSLIDSIIFYLNFAINTLLLIFGYIYWTKKHKAELLSLNIDVSYKRRVRLMNFLIDLFIISLIVLDVTYILNYNNIQIDYFYVFLLFYFIYYFCCELVFRQTIGKVITNSAVIINSDNPLKRIFIRSITRYIPFELFSFIPDNHKGWHDMLSDTKLVSTKDIQMTKPKGLNFLAILSLLILLLFISLISSDSPLSWKIPEVLYLWLPVFFLIPLGASVISLRINKNRTAIVTTVISTIFFVLTLLFTIFLMTFEYQI